MGMYEDVFRASTEDRESFWLKAAEGIDWDVAPHRALDSSGARFHRWFPDARLNVCFNALDRHVEADPPSSTPSSLSSRPKKRWSTSRQAA
ncbi:acetyl-coenzyme A synthetase N-terminal domain-containing protein [Streptomyces sp. ISL-100]|uniref:acetyl-coenzyme A synthetase N-terminal domain-containing protein n=1 Tax=Streptomyces sp. ISL-100 TaxID=2819173 RepID=UPI002035C1CD|nr:acetyl-coenzyme A synthetase N-terminal domain-containing protein [Streptomyces sp. ISL-100]